MKDYRREYYEQPAFSNRDYLKIPGERQRICEVISAIPLDVQNGSILDIGCGNGTFINILPNRYKTVVGLDYSSEVLKYVKKKKVRGNITNLPFKDESFDLVTSLEVLEHLTYETFERGILELERVSKKYIIITVPNEEDLKHSLVMCPKCYCKFSPYFHMRRFNKDVLYNLFSNFKLIKIKEIGSMYYPTLLALYYALVNPPPPAMSICPQCGYQPEENTQDIKNNNFSSFALKLSPLFKRLVKAIWPLKKRIWLLGLYEKSNRLVVD